MFKPLILDSILIRNFKSFGDYDTEIQLFNIGPTLILGDVISEMGGSNGAGKSALVDAILWCLFGRLVDFARPAGRVVNREIGKNCIVALRLKDAVEIVRTRNMAGHSDLIVRGEDIADSTNEAAQLELNRLYGLDFQLFKSSSFCGQFAKPFLRESDVKRKAAFEKMFRMHGFNIYADVAKTMMVGVTQKQDGTKQKVGNHEILIRGLETQINDAFEGLSSFESQKTAKINEMREQIVVLENELKAIVLPPEGLEKRWNIIEKLEDKSDDIEHNITKLESDLTHKADKVKKAKTKIKKLTEYLENAEHPHVAQMKALKEEIDQKIAEKEKLQKAAEKEASDLNAEEKLLSRRATGMEGQGGTTCSKCEQPVPEEYVQEVLVGIQERKDEIGTQKKGFQQTVENLEAEIEELTGKIPNIKAAELLVNMNRSKTEDLEAAQADAHEEFELTGLANTIKNQRNIVKTIAEKVVQNTPSMTMEEANGIISKKESKEEEVARLWNSIKQEEARTNPYESIIEKARGEIAKTQSETKILTVSIKEFDEEIRHLEYIRKAYYERRRMKSFALAELIPYLNERIYYYLSAFGMDDFGLEFTNTLSVSTSQWDYELCSGGEQKRLDVSIQLALYDLYTFMYGHQCNVMVLDEIDGRLDGPGIEAFKNIISNDFASRIGTILVISHKEEMIDAFPSKIMVRKENGFSYVVKNGF